MELFISILGILALPAIVGFSIWSTISSRKLGSRAIIIQPGEKEDKITMANLLLTVPHGEASITDKGSSGLYKVDITYPGKDVLIIAAWPRKSQEGNLAKSVDVEKDIFKSIGSTLVGEDTIDQNTVLLSFSNKQGGLEYALVSFIQTSIGETELMMELTQTNELNKDILMGIIHSIQPAPTPIT